MCPTVRLARTKAPYKGVLLPGIVGFTMHNDKTPKRRVGVSEDRRGKGGLPQKQDTTEVWARRPENRRRGRSGPRPTCFNFGTVAAS